jgi:tight adherence protein B
VTTTVVVPALAVVAGALGAWAVRHADRADAGWRAGAPRMSRLNRGRTPSVPDIGWRWWPLLGAFAGWALDGPVTAVLGAVGVAVAAARVERRRRARLAAAIDEQLADSVRSLAAGMRAGLSVAQAIEHASREAEPPLADAFRAVVDAVGVGGRLDEALARWASEVGTDDARLVVGVLDLHRRSGGDLPRVLDQVAATLRERSDATREVRALTAQARLSGAILGLLPIGFFGFLWTTSRGDIEGAFRTPVGIAAVSIGLVLEAGAFLWIRRLLEVVRS